MKKKKIVKKIKAKVKPKKEVKPKAKLKIKAKPKKEAKLKSKVRKEPEVIPEEDPKKDPKIKSLEEEPKETSIGRIRERNISEEMGDSYIDYAMSVIVARALPDVRDGLKPVHRRILFTMLEEGLRHTAKFRKSASVIGGVLARYHPHGDTAVYDALVRMAQDFSLRYPLVKGQGNFGCFTKDTKVKLCDGRRLSFGNLIKEQKEGKRHWTFSFNLKSKKIEIAEIKNPRMTRKNEKIVEISLDSGEKIKCTSDHRFMLRNGSYEQAKDLKTGESLMPAYFNIKRIRSHYNYLAILQPFIGHYEFIHRLADEYNVRNKEAKKNLNSYILHHKDFNKFNNSPNNIERLSVKQHYKVHLSQVKNLWKDKGDKFRKKHSDSLKQYFSSSKIRKELSERTTKLWQDSNFRAKYPKDHFRNMANKLWLNPWAKKFHQEKIAKQRLDKGFRENNIRSVRFSNERRLLKNPNMMMEMAGKAKISLSKKWENLSYKERVIKSKILNYTSFLLTKYPKLTPEIYERERINNGTPKITNALNYFEDFSDLTNKSQKYNHKVARVKVLKKRENVYDLTIESTHNFLLGADVFVHNSIDGDSAAAYRYTESRLSKIGEEMLKDIEKNTVPFSDNFDGTRQEPNVLPAPVPQLLLNGCVGIAVGMATNIPTHNLTEVCDALIYLLDHPKAETEDLFQFIQGPDFPTGGIIYDRKEIIQAYAQGKGPILTRGKVEVQENEKTNRKRIIISEIPFQVNKSTLIETFANLVQEKKIDGIRDIRDESDKDGMRIVIELTKDAFPQKVLNRLYKFTDLQKTFHLNMLALVDGLQPKVLNLVEVLDYFLCHRIDVITARTKYELQKAKDRTHILEGLYKCLSNIDAVIKIIKASTDREEAEKNLIKTFKLSKIQANAILETKLAALAKLERKKIEDELKALKERIKELIAILNSPEKIKGIIKKEIQEVKENFGDERKTKVNIQKLGEIAEEDLIPQEETIITLTQGGYIKRINPKNYKLQKRGGKGISGMKTMSDDVVEHFLSAKTHDSLLFFTDSGKVFRTPVYEIPEGSRVARGRGLLNFLEMSAEDKVLCLRTISKEDKDNGIKYLAMATKNGIIKKTPLEDFENIRKSGLIAITMKKGDALTNVQKTTGEDDIMMVTKQGQSIRFKEKDLRSMGRTAAGIRGIRIRKGDEIISMDIIRAATKEEDKSKKRYLLVVSFNGFGKRTDTKEYKVQGRGGSGIKTANITLKTGHLVAAKVLSGEEEDLIVISTKGQVIRSKISQIAKLNRSTQGVRLMKLDSGDKIASTTCI